MTSHSAHPVRRQGMDAHTLRRTMGRTHTTVDSPLGPLTLVADEAGRLCGLYMTDHRRQPDIAQFGDADPATFDEVCDQLDEYFAGQRTAFDLPLATNGAAFQERVWAELRAIPFGERRTYGDIASALGDAGLARAVGAANALNPISIVIPCHRVVGADGRLVGYAGGEDRKRFLLDHEARVMGTHDRLF